MAQHYLGPRHAHVVRVSTEVDLAAVAHAQGYGQVGRWLADLAYAQAGRPDLQFGPDDSDNKEGEQLKLTG